MKTYKVKYSRLFTGYSFGRDTGTMEELNCFFSFTLLLGHQRNAKIPLQPRTGKSLVKALNDSAAITGRYNDSYYLVD